MTAPVHPGLLPGCTVYVDGVRMADGQPGESDDEPVVLTDLSVVWGRSNTLDQPAPATCSFSMLDLPGGKRFLELLHIGARVRVQADAMIFPDPSISTIPVLIPGPITNGTASGSGTVSTPLVANDGGLPLTAVYPPRAYTTDPAGWDDIPRTLAGQAWRLQVSLAFPPTFLGWRSFAAEVRPVAWTYPGGSPAVLPDSQLLTPPASGDALFDLTFTPPGGVWLGFQVRVYPVGPTWNDLGPGAWDSLDARSWQGLSTFTVRNVAMLAPAAGAMRSGAVFAGRISDLEARYSLEVGGTIVDVISQDDTAELGSRYVGDEPWPQEGLGTRFNRIVAASGQRIAGIVDNGIALTQVSWQDVDNQPATTLLQKLAQSVGGVLWSATSLATGPYLRIEDIDARPALMKLEMVPPRLQNLFTQPSFENSSTAAFGATNGTLTTQAPASPPSGTRVLQVAATAAGAVNVFLQAAARPPVSVGKLYRATVWVRSVAAGGAATFRIDGAYRDSTGASIGAGYNSGAQPLNSTTWRRVTLNFPAAPATAVAMSIALNVNAGATAGQLLQYDAIQITEISASTDPEIPYFDGDTPDTATVTYAWDGTPLSSTSTRLGQYKIAVQPVATSPGLTLDACSVLLEPVRWQQDSQDDSTRVVVTWKEAATNPTPPPSIKLTDRDVIAYDPGMEEATGRRRVGVSTILATQDDAVNVANSLLARLQSPGWRLSGLTIDLSVETLDPYNLNLVMKILDASTRLGLPILLTNLPDWNPAGTPQDQALYLEGGRFVNTDGYWRLELMVSTAAGQGESLVRWIDVPADVAWVNFGDVTWSQLAGVGI